MKRSKIFINKNFSILVIGQIISLFGSAIQRFALSLYLLDLTGSASIFASILALSMVPIVLLAPLAGVLADRVNRRNLMIVLDGISAVVIGVYGVIVVSGNDHYVIVGIMMLVLSGISTLYQPTVTASIPSLVSEKELLQANGMVYQVSSLSNFLGPILAGVLYGWLGIKGVLLINGISFFVSAVLEVFLEIPYEKKEVTHRPLQLFKAEMKESYVYLKHKNPIIFRMIFTSGLYNLFLVPIFSVGAPYVIKVTLGFSSEIYGVAEGVIALGMIIGATVVSMLPSKFKIGRIYLVLYTTCISMAMMGISLAFGRVTGLVIFTLFGMFIMLALGIANVITNTYVQQVTDSNMLGKISAFGAAFATCCIPLGQLIFGTLLEVMKSKVYLLILVSAFFTLLVTLIVRDNVRRIEKD